MTAADTGTGRRFHQCVCVAGDHFRLLARFSHLTAETGQGNAIHQMTAADNDTVWKKIRSERSFLDGNAGYWWWMKWNESRHSGEKKITLCQKEVDELSRAQLFDRDSSFACVLVPGGPHLVPNFFLAICTLWQRRLRSSLSYTIRRRLSWAHKSPMSTGWLEYVAEQTSPCQWIEWGSLVVVTRENMSHSEYSLVWQLSAMQNVWMQWTLFGATCDEEDRMLPGIIREIKGPHHYEG